MDANDLRSTVFYTKNPNTPVLPGDMVPVIDDLSRVIPMAGFISKTSSEVDAIIAAGVINPDNGLKVGATYFITDILIYARALTPTEFSENVIYKAYNVDWQSVNVTFLGVWTSSLAPAAGEYVCWNLRHYVNLTGANGGSNPSLDATNWLVKQRPDASYVVEYDPAIYDFANAVLVARWDKRGNFKSTPSGMSSIDTFQWGRDAVTNCTIKTSLTFDHRNAVTASANITVLRGALTATDTVNVRGCVITGSSVVNLSGTCNAQYLKCHNSTITSTGGNIADSSVDFFAVLVIGSGTDASLGYYRNCSLTFTGTSIVNGCIVDGGTALSGSFTKTFASEDHSNRTYIRERFNNFVSPTAIDITNASTTITIPADTFYSQFQLSITGGVPSITTVANIPTNLSVKFTLATNNLTLVNGATLKLKGGANKTFAVANEDWVELADFNGVTKEINSGQY
jgi:hypothetical protein